MRRRLLFPAAAAAALSLALSACKDAPEPSAAPAASTPVSIDAIAAEAQGFSLGATMSARTAYVFFDPQCPHCAALWTAARPLRTQSRFVWIPVGILGEKSATQGAALLAATDPVAAMDQHEASLREKGGGIGPRGGTEPQQEAVKRNTALFTRLGFASVPTVVARHAQSGEVVTIEGSLPAPALAQRLGLQAP
ncbi:thioredoxin fold domain-containing protein [Ramlibacter terrae]|uniref:Thioredoxin fold domain-containing protein n=1 Tax=Ramlibacter terrae TaxID=2732511 RepID=A0ABX6P4C3_9BURK|nr:thioredoxin fold domain-containing protein [Ramlibacter terrae]